MTTRSAGKNVSPSLSMVSLNVSVVVLRTQSQQTLQVANTACIWSTKQICSMLMPLLRMMNKNTTNPTPGNVLEHQQPQKNARRTNQPHLYILDTFLVWLVCSLTAPPRRLFPQHCSKALPAAGETRASWRFLMLVSLPVQRQARVLPYPHTYIWYWSVPGQKSG